MRASSFSRIVSALTLALLLPVSAVLTAPIAQAAEAGTDDVTWTVRTGSGELGADRTNFSYALNPGATIEDGLVVANRGTEPLDLAVYAADGYTTEAGEFDVLVAGEESVGIGAWVHTASERVTIAPGESATVPFEISVPEDATPGDYGGAIVTSLGAAADQPGVSVDRRLGIRMSLRVGGELAPALAVEDAQVSWNGGLNPLATGDATLTYTLHNTGNTVVSATEAATIAGPFGWFAIDAGEIPAPPRLLPGESWTQTVTVHDVGPLMLLTASAAITPIVTDAAGTTAPLATVVATTTGWAVPWLVLAVIALVIVGAVLLLRVRGRRVARRRQQDDARVAEAVSQALATDREARVAADGAGAEDVEREPAEVRPS